MTTKRTADSTTTQERIGKFPADIQKALYDITDIVNWLDDSNEPESGTLIEARDTLIKALESSPTEATLKALREKVRAQWDLMAKAAESSGPVNPEVASLFRAKQSAYELVLMWLDALTGREEGKQA